MNLDDHLDYDQAVRRSEGARGCLVGLLALAIAAVIVWAIWNYTL